MQVASRFILSSLIEIGASVSRYSGSLQDGNSAEICLFHKADQNDLNESLDHHNWFQRFRLTQLIECTSCLAVLDFEETGDQPFVAFVEGSVSVEDLMSDPVFIESQLVDIAVACLTALVACEGVGLVIGGVTPAAIRRVNKAVWQVDISGLRSNKLDSDGLLQSSESGTLTDAALDLRSIAVLLNRLIEQCGLINSPIAQRVKQAFAKCLANNSNPLGNETAEGPSARDLLRQLDMNASVALQPNLQVPLAGDGLDVTMESAPEIAVPEGLIPEGTQLGRYKIRERLGSGAMGAVYRAEDLVDGRGVAIKVLNKRVAHDSISARRFAKEARLLAKANNPYVANLYEVVSEGELPYLVVEYVEGGTLGSLLKPAQPLDDSFALSVMIDAARGLAIAHSRGVVHRDFKPDNVLLTADAKKWLAENTALADPRKKAATPDVGRIYAKVSDFGLARTTQQSESMALTRDGSLMGTPLYMAPEQCRGEATDPRTDVYSIGVTLYQLLAGNPPFEADSQVALLNLHCTAVPPSLRKLRPELSDALVQTIEKCLAKNPEARYADAGDLVVDLENILRGQPTSLGLHPPILSLNDPDVLQFEHAWELQSSPHQLWPYISNTDRVNHAIGLPAVKYTVRQDPVHGVQRFAETKVAGMLIRWQEHPYEWIEGRRMSVLREFTHGPFRWFVNVVELTPTIGGGTLVTQKLIVTPRNWVGKQFAKIQLGQKSKANFGRTYQQIDSYIAQSEMNKADRDPFIGRTELRAAQRQRLQSRLDQLREKRIDPRVVDTLGQFLENASDLEVARIRPIAFAERFQLDQNQVINACFEGTRLGVFSLLWDIMCPSCRIPADVQETLAAIKDHGYCEACNLDYGIDLAESVELIFRAHPEIREVTTGVYCIGGPASSRHVVAQVRLAAGERFACELNLSEGAYIVRGQQLPFTIDLRVAHNCLVKRIELSLARPPTSPRTLLSVGSQVVHLCNDSPVDQQVRIERTAGRHDALSAARASTMALFRELFPNEVLSADQIVSVAHITVMRVQILGTQQLYESLGDAAAFGHIRSALQAILATVKENSGAVVKTIGEGVLASFPSAMSAVQAAVAMIRDAVGKELPIAVAAHSGSAMVATLEDRLDYFGKTLQTLELLLRSAEPRSLHVTTAITELTEVQTFLSQHQLKVELLSQLKLPSGNVALKVSV